MRLEYWVGQFCAKELTGKFKDLDAAPDNADG